jgi:hypothetical protein
VEDYQRRCVFPIDQFPGEQRVLGLRLADVAGIFLVVVVLPLGEQIVAVAVADLGSPVSGSWSSERASTGP